VPHGILRGFNTFFYENKFQNPPFYLANPGPWQCALFLIPRSFHDGGALNYSTAPHRSKTTLISNGVFCLLESKILSIGQTLLYSLGQTHAFYFSDFVQILFGCPYRLPKLPGSVDVHRPSIYKFEFWLMYCLCILYLLLNQRA
jgi:hypothetical protein